MGAIGQIISASVVMIFTYLVISSAVSGNGKNFADVVGVIGDTYMKIVRVLQGQD